MEKSKFTALKIVSIHEEWLEFENGLTLEGSHTQDCCESHWLDFGALSHNNFIGKNGERVDLFNQTFNFKNGIPFKKVKGVGIMLYDTDDNNYLVCGYGDNNGYYSSDLTLLCADKGHIIYEEDITECQDYYA